MTAKTKSQANQAKHRSRRKKQAMTLEAKVASGQLGFGLTLRQNLKREGLSESQIKRLLKSLHSV